MSFQGVPVVHHAVDSVQDCLLERLFLQCFRVLAVFRPVVQAASAPPNSPLDPALIPHAPAVACSAVAAEHEICQDVLPAVLAPPGGRALAGAAGLRPAPGHLQLRRVEDVPAHNPLVVVLNQILWELAVVPDHLFADAVLNECLLEQRVAAVFLIA